MSESTALKDMLFEPEVVRAFAAAVSAEYSKFDSDSFEQSVFNDEWDGLELMDRMRHITQVLHEHFPADYSAALEVLLELVDHGEEIGGFMGMVPCDYVATYGLEHPDASIRALARLTTLASAEFAVRPYILRYQDHTLREMQMWSGHTDPRVRRLASEGCRPRLPWGIGLPTLKADPSPVIPILDALRDDDSEDVRRSVANNLNDISKDNASVVIDVLRRWQKEDDECFADLRERALRTLVKAGDPEALELLGYPRDPQIDVANVSVTPLVIELDSTGRLTFEVTSRASHPQNLMIDYVVHYVKANGRTAPKVWKLAKRALDPGQTISISKTLSFRAVTTRKYYTGTHSVQPKINGRLYDLVQFEVVGSQSKS